MSESDKNMPTFRFIILFLKQSRLHVKRLDNPNRSEIMLKIGLNVFDVQGRGAAGKAGCFIR